MTKTKTKIFLIHGFESSPKKHWFEWLKKVAQKDLIEVCILEMPNPCFPKLKEWVAKMKHTINTNENTYLIGHSLGGISVLRYIESLDLDSKIGGFILISPFAEKLPQMPILDEFTKAELNTTKIKQIAQTRIIIAAKDDYIVPYTLSQNLSQSIEARFILLEEGGHFMQEDGIVSFELLYDLIKNL